MKQSGRGEAETDDCRARYDEKNADMIIHFSTTEMELEGRASPLPAGALSLDTTYGEFRLGSRRASRRPWQYRQVSTADILSRSSSCFYKNLDLVYACQYFSRIASENKRPPSSTDADTSFGVALVLLVALCFAHSCSSADRITCIQQAGRFIINRPEATTTEGCSA